MNNNKKLLIFDFDGTIVDSFDEIVDIFRFLAEKHNLEEIKNLSIEEIRSMPSKKFYEKVSRSKFKIMYLIWKGKRMFTKRMSKIKAFPEMARVLKKIGAEDIEMGVLTSNSKKNAEIFLRREGIDCFDFVFSSGIFGKAKKLSKIAEKYGYKKENIFYFGDETRDIRAAKKAGVNAIAVVWGFNSKEVLKKTGPDFICDEPEDMLELI